MNLMERNWPSQWEIDNSEWQFAGEDTWVFGVKVRGAVRRLLADICFDEERDGPGGGWVWQVYRRKEGVWIDGRGVAISRFQAMEDAEVTLGIVDKGET